MMRDFTMPRNFRGRLPISDAHVGGCGMPECPHCSCGAVEDWEGEAQLRCTGCHRPLNSPRGLVGHETGVAAQ